MCIRDSITAVTATQIRDHAQLLLTNARPALALYGPVEAAPSRDALAERLAA